MIIDDVIEKIFRKRQSIIRKENRDAHFVIYMDKDSWYTMMSELKGQLTSYGYDTSQNNGKRIAGFPVYVVITSGHGIEIFETSEKVTG